MKRKGSRKQSGRHRGLRQRVTAAVMSVLTVLTMTGPSVPALAAPGDQHTVTFAVTNKLGEKIPDADITLEDSEGNEIPASDMKDDTVIFEGLYEGASYQYTVDVGEDSGYEVPEEKTEIEIGDKDETVPVVLYTEPPECSAAEEVSAVFGGKAVLSVVSQGEEPVSYQWYFGEEKLEGETEASLVIDPVTLDDEGTYVCTVETALSDKAVQEIRLQVQPAEPEIKLDVQNVPLLPSWVNLTATVSHPDSGSAEKPEGEVEFYIDGEYEDSRPLRNGKAERKYVRLGSDDRHTVYAKYISADERKYKSGESDPQMYGKRLPVEGADYTAAEPDGATGWYNAEHPLILTAISDGEFDRIWDGGAWVEQMTVTEEGEGREITIRMKNSETGKETDPGSYRYSLDLQAPYKIGMSAPDFRNYDRRTDTYEIEFTAVDDLSGVSSVTWYDAGGKAHEAGYRDGKFVAEMTAEEWKSVRRIEVSDRAGNTGERTEIGNRYIEIAYPGADRITDQEGDETDSDQAGRESRFFYQESQITVSVTASDGAVPAEGFHIFKNGVEEPVSVEFTEDPGTGLFSGEVLLSTEGAYSLSVQAEGYTVFSSEYAGAACGNGYASCEHILDKTEPVIKLSYTPDALPDGMTGFGQVRTATVTVREPNFRPDELGFTEFSAEDINGDALESEKRLRKELESALRMADWKEENGVYTAENVLEFDTDAVYSFEIGCTDLAGNTGTYKEEPFSVDRTAPEGLEIVYDTNPISAILHVLSLGFYNPSVTVTLSAEDEISGIGYFSWTYEREDGASTTGNPEREEGQISWTDENFISQSKGKKAVASFKLSGSEAKQYRGSISFTVTDKAGNTSRVHDSSGAVRQEDGSLAEAENGHVVIVDTIAPKRTVRYPQPQKIRDRETMEPYTGDLAEYANLENTGSILYYDHTCRDGILAEVTIEEANFYEEDVKIFVNGEEYHIDGWRTQGDERTGYIELTEDGTYSIDITYTDRSGNEMASYHSERIVLDRTPPEVEKYEFIPAASDGTAETSDFIEYLEYGYYFKTDFDVVVTASDTVSGMDRIDYRLVSYENGEKKAETAGSAPVSEGKARISVPSGFKGQIYAEGFDNAGNSSEEVTSRAFVMDGSAPEVEIADGNSTEYTDAGGNALYVSDISITVSVTDRTSGIREIVYAQSSEKGAAERKITLDNTGYRAGDQLEDGWLVAETDENLVTKVSRTFVYQTDDNDIVLSVSASDRAGNEADTVSSRRFTIDKTAPVIDVVFRDDDDSDLYYNADRIADVTVTERNFDEKLINTAITNEIGDVPEAVFTKVSEDTYTAQIVFDEGDYTFEITGSDLGGHEAAVNYAGGNEHLFYVDKTTPAVTDNFAEFSKPQTENSFQKEKNVSISVIEHHFDPDLMGLRVYAKEAGAEHSADRMEDVTDSMVSAGQWKDDGDVHTLTFEVGAEAVYRIEMTPSDLAGNTSDPRSTVVFEIDTTEPVIEKRNGNYVSPDDTEFLDIYAYDRAGEPAPTLEFSDANIEYLEYSLTVWKPDYTSSEAAVVMEPVKVYPDGDAGQEGILNGGKFEVPDFTEDGVYALEVTAVDTAGNRSELNVSTYARETEQDVLAFILDSNVERESGLYSFQYEDGTPISMRPDSFEDLDILVMAKAGTDVDVVLRDMNAEEMSTSTQVTADDSIHGFTVYNYTLKSDFFRDRFDDDTDTNLYLSVKNEGKRVDLGEMHIDSAVPVCELPEEFSSWHWYFGDGGRTVTLTGISELLDENETRIYDNGSERSFVYSPEEGTLTFTLEKGWHNIGIALSDTAGNINYIQERTNIYIGYFWLWVILLICLLTAAAAAGTVLVYRYRGQKMKEK